MKTINHLSRNLGCCFAALTIAGLLALPTTGSAQEQIKGAQKLLQLNAGKTVAAARTVPAGEKAAMSCPQCKNSRVAIVEAPTKTGAKPETKFVVRHECPDCSQKVVIEGHGKTRTDKLVHACKQSSRADALCCVQK